MVFDCGSEPYGAEGTAICDVGTDGGDFSVQLTPADPPPGVTVGQALHHPDYDRDDSIVFEADWGGGEAVWIVLPGSESPVPVAEALTNNNSPCVLPNGQIVSLWLNRSENRLGVHELTLVTDWPATLDTSVVLLPDIDVLDIGLGCGDLLTES